MPLQGYLQNSAALLVQGFGAVEIDLLPQRLQGTESLEYGPGGVSEGFVMTPGGLFQDVGSNHATAFLWILLTLNPKPEP